MSRLLQAVQEATPEEVAELLAPVGCQSFAELFEKVSALEGLEEGEEEDEDEGEEEEDETDATDADLDAEEEEEEEEEDEEETDEAEEGFDEEALIQEMKALGIDPDMELVESVSKIPAGTLRETAVRKMAPRTIATNRGGSSEVNPALAEKVASSFPNPIKETK